MSDFAPLEAYYRDYFFDNPWDLLQDIQCDGISRCRRWREFSIPGGSIDLLLQYRNHVRIVEFKRERIDENAVGQILRYIGIIRELAAISDFAGRERVEVSGILAAPDITSGAKAALRALDGHWIPVEYVRLSMRVDSCVEYPDVGVSVENAESFERVLLQGDPDAIGWSPRIDPKPVAALTDGRHEAQPSDEPF